MNKVILSGRLGGKPVIRETASGKVANVSLATTEVYIDKNKNKVENTTWHYLVLWNRNAENIVKWVDKGHRIQVEGAIQKNKYKDNDGVERESVQIVVSRFYFIDTIKNPSEAGTTDGAGDTSAPKPAGAAEGNGDMEDVPF